MRHGIDDVVDGEAGRERRQIGRVARVVAMFPGIAEVHIVIDRDHEPAVVVVYAAPMGVDAAVLVGDAGAEQHDSPDLGEAIEVVEKVKDLVVRRYLDDRPMFAEVAFAGKSNVGKSSLINALVGRRKLARTSNTPGRTRELVLFRVKLRDGAFDLVDLPGYGYAKVSKTERRAWGPMIEPVATSVWRPPWWWPARRSPSSARPGHPD